MILFTCLNVHNIHVNLTVMYLNNIYIYILIYMYETRLNIEESGFENFG
jgi:hypothetical protein